MNLIYEGTDITPFVNITRCVHRDVSGGRADSLELEMDHAETWYRWKPQTDDTIRLRHGGYDTGTLYLNSILPQRDKYIILATSLPAAARRKAWGSYRAETLKNIFEKCAAECGMEASLYGLDGGLFYPFVLRQNEGNAAFLNRLGEWEGATVKAFNGVFRAIGVDYAQRLKAAHNITITTHQDGVGYIRRENTKYSGLTICTPYAQASAYDVHTAYYHQKLLTHLPARDNTQAGRWARGLLMMNNRKAEELTISGSFNAGMSAMMRVDVDGNTDANGEWIVDESTHDFVNERTRVKMLRVVDL